MFKFVSIALPRLGARAGGFALIPLLSACAAPNLGLPASILGADQQPALTDSAASESRPVSAASASPTSASAPSADTTQASAVLTEARALRRSGEKKKAFDVIEASVAKTTSPERALLIDGGLLALEVGAPDKAERYLRQAHDPTRPDWRVLSGLGVAASSQGRFEDAKRHFKAALETSPGQASVLNNLALSHVLERNPAEAEKVLRDAAKAAPKSARIKQNLALSQGLKGRGDESSQESGPTASDRTPAPAITAPRKAANATQPTADQSTRPAALALAEPAQPAR